jgi:hypothetical protein
MIAVLFTQVDAQYTEESMSEPRGTPLTLPPVYRLALQWLAAKDHHTFMSVAARKAIDTVMRQSELGPEWESKVAQALEAEKKEPVFA